MTLVVVVAMSSAGSKQPIPTILEDIPETPLLPCPPLFFRAIFWKNKRSSEVVGLILRSGHLAL